MDMMLPDLQYDITGVPAEWLWKGKHLMGIWGEYCIVPLGSSWYFYLLRCSWGGSILQVLLGPCWKMASLWPSSLSCSASHRRFGPDKGFSPQPGLKAGWSLWVDLGLYSNAKGAMAYAVAGEMNTALGHQNISNMVQKCEEGLVFRNLVCFFPRFPPTKTSPFPQNSSHLKSSPFGVVRCWEWQDSGSLHCNINHEIITHKKLMLAFLALEKVHSMIYGSSSHRTTATLWISGSVTALTWAVADLKQAFALPPPGNLIAVSNLNVFREFVIHLNAF